MSVGIIAVLAGYLPSGFNIPSWLSLVVSVALVVGLIMLLGKPERKYQEFKSP
jgi:tetrahydromethanopterin S-methyltransferase subunit C